ncbi:uncharacterized protein LOC136061784 isoform X2 [Quercus suber]|uniref:uncharacterized protein LOC136061784 isoform X2 n=1 Tax=Quercus suber TaxID=58331 RepID=UPI0032DE6959
MSLICSFMHKFKGFCIWLLYQAIHRPGEIWHSLTMSYNCSRGRIRTTMHGEMAWSYYPFFSFGAVWSSLLCTMQGKLVLAPLMEFETSTTKNLFDYFPQCLKESNCFGLIEWQIEMMVPLSIQPIS